MSLPGLPLRLAALVLLFIVTTGIRSSLAADVLAVQRVNVIPLAGEVGPGMAVFLKRALRDAGDNPQDLFVFEIDTFGGRVDSALEIADLLVDRPAGKTIAYVQAKAISAGALIALACNELFMRPHSTIGDVAPISVTSDGPKMMGEKFQSPLRAKFRSLAKRNGYPERLAEAMVTAEMEVFRVEIDGKARYMDATEIAEYEQHGQGLLQSKKTIVAAGELLTMDDIEAHELGFSELTVADIKALLTSMGIENYDIIRFDQNWSESFGGFVATLAPFLLMIGMAALYTEIKAPGFGLPGILGLTCLGLVFFNQYLMGLADHLELILIVIGLLLLGFEIFVLPGMGIAGPAGFLCIGIGMILSFQNFILPDPELPWQMDLLVNNILHVLGSFVLAFVLAFAVLRYLLPRIGTLVDGPYLHADLSAAHDRTSTLDTVKIGDTGTALTLLRPSGKADFSGVFLDVLSEGEYIPKDSRIVIREIKGNRIIVARGEGG